MTHPSPTPSWQDVLNPALVQRLIRPAQQAGLIRTQQARALLTRHQKMTAGLPLAALGQRGGAIADVAAGQVPIVYAQPAAMGDAPTASLLPSSGTPTALTQLHTTVIQRQMMPGATVAAPAPDAVQPLPTTHEIFNTMPMAAPPASVAMPVVQPAWVRADSPVVTDSSPAATSVVPVIRINPNIPHAVESDRSNSARLMPLTSVLPASTQISSAQTQTTLWVVREQPMSQHLAHSGTPMPSAQAIGSGQGQLPYVETLQTHSTSTSANPTLDETPRTSVMPQRTSPTHPTSASPQRLTPVSQPAHLNVDEIVDKVHRKFLRRLASEAERRGVR